MRPEPPDFYSARIAAGFPVAAQAARRAGMRPGHLIRLERGGRDPAWSTVARLIAGLGLGLEWFHDADAIMEAAERIQAQRVEQQKGQDDERADRRA